MKLKSKNIGNITILYPEGSMDALISTEIEEELKEIINTNSKNHIVLNMQELTHISSSGLRILFRAAWAGCPCHRTRPRTARLQQSPRRLHYSSRYLLWYISYKLGRLFFSHPAATNLRRSKKFCL